MLNRRARSCVDEDPLASKDARAAIDERNLNRPRFNKTALAHDQLCAERFVFVEMNLDQPVDHPALVRAHAGHIDLPIALGDPNSSLLWKKLATFAL